MAAAEVARRWKKFEFFAFFSKRPLAGQFSKFCSERIHCLTDWRVMFKFREIWKTENRWNRALLNWQQKKQNFASLSRSRYCADRNPKCARATPRMYSECFRFHPNRFPFGGVTSERVNTVTARSKVNGVFDWSLASSWITRTPRPQALKRTALANCHGQITYRPNYNASKSGLTLRTTTVIICYAYL